MSDKQQQLELRTIEGEVLPLRDGGEGAAMFRASVEIAKRYPRDIPTIVKTLIATLDAFPEFAEKALYSIPYKDKKTGRIVKVEGMSIRAAETIASEWGNIRVAVRITSEDETGYDLEAVAHDMQTNNISALPARVLRVSKVGNQFVVMDPDRMRMALNAGISKVKRNVTMSVIPLQIKAGYEKRVRELLAGGDLNKLADTKRVATCITAFQADFGVTQEQLERYVGKPVKEWLGRDLADLRATYNALEDNETTVIDTFGKDEPAEETKSPVADAKVTEAESGVLGSAAQPKPEPKPEPAKAAKVDKKPEPPKEEPKARDPIFDPAPKADPPAAAGGGEPPSGDEAMLADFKAKLAACATKAEMDTLLGRLYAHGAELGPGSKIARPVRVAMITLINERRDALAKATDKK